MDFKHLLFLRILSACCIQQQQAKHMLHAFINFHRTWYYCYLVILNVAGNIHNDYTTIIVVN